MKFRGKFSSGFRIGITTSGFPGIPLDPKNLNDREDNSIDWLELEFYNSKGTVASRSNT
jgi:hypothetical protein